MTEQIAEQPPQTEVLAELDLPVLIPSVGEQLKAAREKAGLSVIDLAQMLKLGVRQVQALEDGDWNALPGPTFIRGFVRNYARLMTLDSDLLMTQLDLVTNKPTTVLHVPESTPTHIPYRSSAAGGDRNFVLIGLLAALFAVLSYFFIPDDLYGLREQAQSFVDSLSREDEAPVSAAGALLPTSPTAVNEPLFPPGATPQQIMTPPTVLQNETLPISVVGNNPTEKAAGGTSTAAMSFEVVRESWIEVKDRDDKIIFSKKMSAGSQQDVSGAGPFTLAIGYAPGVKLKWLGNPVDLEPHSRGDVARLVLE